MRAPRISCAAISFCIAVLLVFCSALALAQTDSGTVSGRVLDPAGRSVRGARVRLIDIDRGTTEESATNSAGLYTFRAVHPGRFRMEVEARGFKLVNITGLTVNTQANLEQNFTLSIGSVSESITVEAKASDVSTSVNTVVDRQFVQNLPLNGRSFQSLMQLTPGVVVTPTSDSDSGQFSVNGQRASANYFMVDGVSANIGASFNTASTQNAAGSMPGLSVLGGTNNLVSVDALQEFRIQTSSYAPEFGRVPGAQISLETRSGTNEFHGTLFEYLRNDALDANNWFNGDVTPGAAPLKKSQERQNDFGGVFGGPIFRNKTFFFFSYEQEILRLPRTALSEVPSVGVRQDPSTPAAILPLLNAYPIPNGTASAAETAQQIAPFSASFSDPSTLKAVSLRIDHRVGDHLAFFGRYNYSPSSLLTRVAGALAINDLTRFNIKTETATFGAMWSPEVSMNNDLRFNYSWNRADGNNSVDSFGGAIVPPDSFFLPPPFTTSSSAGALTIANVGGLRAGPLVNELQRQINIVDGFSLQKKRHAIKFGIDYRRLSPNVMQPDYFISTVFLNVPTAVSLAPLGALVEAANPVTILFHNLGAYAQDTWAVSSRFSATWGVRWDVDFSPSTAHGPDFLALAN
ncbi:MAG: TonB-dependent receptor domain-containing protein, partial [Actinomycetota bacterium]